MCVYIDFSACFYTHAHIHIDIHTHLKTLTQIKKITVTNLYLLICKDLRSTKRKPSKSQVKALSYITSPD